MRKILLVSVACVSLSASLAAQTAAPPVAKKIHTERQLNGGVLVDDYAWLTQRNNRGETVPRSGECIRRRGGDRR